MNMTCPIWAPSRAAPHPDAELVALCMSFIALEEAARAEPRSDEYDLDETPLEKEVDAKQSAMIDRLYGIRAQTVEGAVMRLRAAVAYLPGVDPARNWDVLRDPFDRCHKRPDGGGNTMNIMSKPIAGATRDNISTKRTRKPSPAVPALSPVQPGLSTAGMYRLIEQARDACTELDEQQAAMPKDAHLARRLNEAHQRLLWEYQEHIAQAASFLKPRNMVDVLAMLKLIDDKAEDLAANDHEANNFDIPAEMVALRRMARGCLPIVAAELGVELNKALQTFCEVAFPEVPR